MTTKTSRSRRLHAALALGSLFIAGSGVAIGVTACSSAATAAPMRIMPLGDSITGSPGCWRALLWQKLQQTGYTNIDMVGTLGPQGCSVPYDGDNEGHGGALVTTVADQNQLVGWLSATNPNIVMMHFGTNDIWSNRSTSQILTAYSKLVDQMRANNPAMKILVAKIIPVAPSSCAECPQRTIDLNAAIPAWAASKTTSASPITVVDQWTGWNAASDTSDGVHPNDIGIVKMSDKWYAPLAAAISGTGPTPTPTPTPPPTPTAGASCTATYTVANQWTGGFVAGVKVTAGNAAINGWKVTLALASGATITNSWNAQIAGTSGTVTAANLSYNGRLAATQGADFGFQGLGVGSGATATCTAS